MKKPFIQTLIEQQDQSQLELVPDYNLEKILTAVCAFLNSHGGWVVVGYGEGKVKGVEPHAEEIAGELETAILNQIFPQAMVYTKAIEFENHYLILINVIKGPRAPYSYNDTYYIRNGKEIRIARYDDISMLIRSSNGHLSLWEKSDAVDVELKDLSEEEIRTTINDANRLGKGDLLPNEIDRFLSYFQLLDYSSVRNGAVVLFGYKPARYLPQERIRITVMPDEKTGNRYEDTTTIESNLFEAFNQLQNYFKKSLPLISEFSQNNWDRNSRFLYPLDALDEAIINAMVHRDYGDVGGEITINIFSNRMEIINSGEIPGNIITNKNKIGPHHSILRNPTIAHMFFLRGKMEKLGRGLDLILGSFSNIGLKKPEWSSKDGYTTLTLFNTRDEVVLNSRMTEYLRHMDSGKTFTSKDYHSYFSTLTDRIARSDISKLAAGGWIEKIGEGPATKYMRTKIKLPESSE